MRIPLTSRPRLRWILAGGLLALACFQAWAAPDPGPMRTFRVAVGGTPKSMVLDPETGWVFTADGQTGTVVVYDPAAGRILRRLATPGAEVLALDPALHQVYALCPARGGIQVLSTTGRTAPERWLPVGDNPQAIAVNPGTGQVFVALAGDGTGPGEVALVDGATLKCVRVGVGVNPRAIAVNPATGRVYVANAGDGTVSVLDPGRLDSWSARIQVGRTPCALAVDPATDQVFVANRDSGSLTVIAGTGLATVQVAVPPRPVALELDRARGRVYVVHDAAARGAVTELACATREVLRTVPVGAGPSALAVDPGSGRVYVACPGEGLEDGEVAVLQEGALVATVPVDRDPLALVLDAGTGRVYSANAGSGTLTVLAGEPH